MTTHWARRAAMLAVAATVTTAACSGTADTPPRAPIPMAGRGAPTSMAEIRFPFDAYQLTPEQQAEQSFVHTVIRTRCERRTAAGAAGPDKASDSAAAQIHTSVAITHEFASRRYGISDPTLAHTYGYQLSPKTLGVSRPKSVSDLSASERSTLASCSADADRIVYGSTAQQSGGTASALARQTRDAFAAAQKDPQVKTVVASWSACMKVHGYRYANPIEAAGDPRWSHQDSAPGTSEINVATTDVTCKSQANLLGVEAAVESTYQQHAIDTSAQLFTALKQTVTTDGARIQALMRQYAN